MIPATRIARRLMRKIAKPAALWWTNLQLARCEYRADHFYVQRVQSIPMELAERKRQVALTAKRNSIQNW
jgi:hypothetical protein